MISTQELESSRAAGAPGSDALASDPLACAVDAGTLVLDALFDELTVTCFVVEHPVIATATIVVANTSFRYIPTSSWLR
ncbi:hypothetical protein MAUB_17030 [Mycolicibacterium aubagnense]|uniref:Uncharacterized protein n=1 Tax=Mycolicibacterium aubagnense TaxID=319707 RepID=A0ABM7IB21_9MYCO|nr:hypothetical protein MAUB_17030 [Mycolicibacterium aubagnense]